jgi:galactokinase
MTDLRSRLLESFALAFGCAPDVIARAPGRVNLIGEHTDYNDGFVLPAAIGVETLVAIRRRGDDQINLVAADFDHQQDRFTLSDRIDKSPLGWANYARGMIQSLIDAGFALCGADIAIAGNVPQGAGLSSSASFEVAVGQAFKTLCGLDGLDSTMLARVAQRAECDFVGTKCGIMDQLVSARGAAGHALLIDCRSLETQAVPVPETLVIMIVHSGITRGLVDGAYNERRAQCEAAAAHFGVVALRDLDEDALMIGGRALDPVTFARARHVVTENARTVAAAAALRADDLAALGRLMAQSHASMRDDFDITLPAIDQLVAILQRSIGSDGGARMTGGGFGGAVVALMHRAKLAEVAAAVSSQYRTPAGVAPQIMIETAQAGAGNLSL